MVSVFPEPGVRWLSYPHRLQERLCCGALGWVAFILGSSADPLIWFDAPVPYTELLAEGSNTGALGYSCIAVQDLWTLLQAKRI